MRQRFGHFQETSWRDSQNVRRCPRRRRAARIAFANCEQDHSPAECGSDLGCRSLSMMTTSRCDCLVCRLETSLIGELNDDRSNEEFRLFAVASPILSSFLTACELIQQLHSNDRREESLNGDAVLFELLKRSNDTLFRPMRATTRSRSGCGLLLLFLRRCWSRCGWRRRRPFLGDRRGCGCRQRL
jgi:hypothetical protein